MMPAQGVCAAPAPHPRKPPRHVVLPPAAFASDWGSRPTDDVAVGLRFVSAEDERIARAVGIKRAHEQIATRGKVLDKRALDEAYNDEVVCILVARAMCDPNDTARAFELMPVAEDQIHQAMTADGVRRLWDEMGLLHAGCGVAMPIANDEDLARLGRILSRGKAATDLSQLNAQVAIFARKLAFAVLERLEMFDDGAAPEPEAPDDQDDEVAVYEAGAPA